MGLWWGQQCSFLQRRLERAGLLQDALVAVNAEQLGSDVSLGKMADIFILHLPQQKCILIRTDGKITFDCKYKKMRNEKKALMILVGEWEGIC